MELHLTLFSSPEADFPGSPVVKTLYFQCRGFRLKKLRLHMPLMAKVFLFFIFLKEEKELPRCTHSLLAYCV